MANEFILQNKASRQNGAAGIAMAIGNEYTFWLNDGNPGAGATPPTTYANPTNATAGSLMQSNPPGGKQKWLQSMLVCGAWAGRLILYDRLLHMSGFSGNINTVQNVNSGSPATLSRHYQDDIGTNDVGNEIFLEVYSALGATPATASLVYSNTTGTSQTATASIPANLGAQRIVRAQLAAGDIGVRDITSVQLSVATGTPGNFGIIVAHRLAEVEIGAASTPELWTAVGGSKTEILTGACLAWYAAITTASTPTSYPLDAFMQFVDG